MQNGKVAKVMENGFGFISVDGQDNDLFFHMNDFNGNFDDLTAGTSVSFEITEGQKGPAAINVNVVDGTSDAPAEEA